MKKRLILAPALAVACAPFVSAQTDPGYSLFGFSYVGVGNYAINGNVTFVDGDHSNDGAGNSHWNATATYGGNDASGHPTTETFNATTHGSSSFGSLHSFAGGSVTNLFYNADNPLYYNANTGEVNPNGTPDLFYGAAYSGFTDTLAYGGVALQGGYQARYLFHLEGTNTGVSRESFIQFDIDGSNPEYFYGRDDVNDLTVGTMGYAVNGQTPQRVTVQLISDIAFGANYLTSINGDRIDVAGQSNFSDTATLTGIELLDANGHIVPTSQWSVTSASGTHYAQIGAVPSPASFIPFAGGTMAFLRRRRKTRAR